MRKYTFNFCLILLTLSICISANSEIDYKKPCIGFCYQDNTIIFDDGWGKPDLNYIIDHWAITYGQDPEKRIYDGKPYWGTGEMSFSVGRKGSTSTAEWFIEQTAGSSHNIFGVNPSKLNFAFIGPLIIRITNGTHVRFKDIVLAQGNDGYDNIWWIGGTYCKKVPSKDMLDCGGTNLDSNKYQFFRFQKNEQSNIIDVAF